MSFKADDGLLETIREEAEIDFMQFEVIQRLLAKCHAAGAVDYQQVRHSEK